MKATTQETSKTIFTKIQKNFTQILRNLCARLEKKYFPEKKVSKNLKSPKIVRFP